MSAARTWQAAGMASVLEAALIAGVVMVVATAVPHPQPRPTYVPLVIEPLVEVPKKVEPEKPPEPKPVEVPKPKPQPVAKIEPVVPPPVVPQPVVATPPPDAIVEQVPPPPPPVVRQQQEAVDPALAYNGELTKAVQAAFRVPGAAEAARFKGRARVQFALQDGKVSAVKLLETSTMGAVDRAAVKAVESANFPPPPDALRGQLRTYQIWVECY